MILFSSQIVKDQAHWVAIRTSDLASMYI